MCVCVCVSACIWTELNMLGPKDILITVLVPCYISLMSENAHKNVTLLCSGIVLNVFQTQSKHAVFIRYSRGLKVLGLQLFLCHLWLFLVQQNST